MRLLEFTTVELMEGGNIWQNDLATNRISKELVGPTVAFLEKITGLPLLGNMLGSTGIKETSGDIDLGVDAKKYSKDELVSKLQNWSSKKDKSAFIKKSGICVHFRCPIAGKPNMGSVQVDFMFVPNLKFTHWSMTSNPDTKFQNKLRIILIASLAKALGYRFDATKGLTNRETGKSITKGLNPDALARILLNSNARAKDLTTIEGILAALRNDPKRNEKLSDARETFLRYGESPNILK